MSPDTPATGPGSPDQGEEDTFYTPMLKGVAKPATTTQPVPEIPNAAPPPDFTREVAAIEAAMGSSPAEARIKADQTAATLEAGLVGGGLPELPALSPAEFIQEVKAMTALVEDIARRSAPNVLAAE